MNTYFNEEIFPNQYKEKKENTSKHSDAFGIDARKSLRAYENKFSKPLPFSLHYRKRQQYALREKHIKPYTEYGCNTITIQIGFSVQSTEVLSTRL